MVRGASCDPARDRAPLWPATSMRSSGRCTRTAACSSENLKCVAGSGAGSPSSDHSRGPLACTSSQGTRSRLEVARVLPSPLRTMSRSRRRACCPGVPVRYTQSSSPSSSSALGATATMDAICLLLAAVRCSSGTPDTDPTRWPLHVAAHEAAVPRSTLARVEPRAEAGSGTAPSSLSPLLPPAAALARAFFPFLPPLLPLPLSPSTLLTLEP
mmetsp:Transcript_22621/g.57550  ORF Transcript_22621/g.57550 Transcript_22621/m.57550 type:complete len:213 (-) Transcript_22621:1269-1907(-)